MGGKKNIGYLERKKKIHVYLKRGRKKGPCVGLVGEVSHREKKKKENSSTAMGRKRGRT